MAIIGISLGKYINIAILYTHVAGCQFFFFQHSSAPLATVFFFFKRHNQSKKHLQMECYSLKSQNVYIRVSFPVTMACDAVLSYDKC